MRKVTRVLDSLITFSKLWILGWTWVLSNVFSITSRSAQVVPVLVRVPRIVVKGNSRVIDADSYRYRRCV